MEKKETIAWRRNIYIYIRGSRYYIHKRKRSEKHGNGRSGKLNRAHAVPENGAIWLTPDRKLYIVHGIALKRGQSQVSGAPLFFFCPLPWIISNRET